MPVFHYLEASFLAAAFSEKTNGYYKNTKGEAFFSCLMPIATWIFVSLVLCGLTTCHHYTGLYRAIPIIAYLIVVGTIALPKFILFFAMTWALCKYMGQTEYFPAFMAANNWFYFPYLLLYSAKALLASHVEIPHPETFVYATAFYIAMVVFFLAHNVLRLASEVAWLVPLFIFITHGLVKWITTKNGMFLVF
jgi:hypothetical protein